MSNCKLSMVTYNFQRYSFLFASWTLQSTHVNCDHSLKDVLGLANSLDCGKHALKQG